MRYCSLILLCGALYALSCQKDEDPNNLDLSNKPLSTVKRYTEGRFTLLFSKGGFFGMTIHFNDRGYNLVNDQFTWIVADTVLLTSKAEWESTTDINTNKPVYMLKYKNSYGTYESLAVLRIDSGRLVMSSNAIDGADYYFQKKP
jgi:hypothetical protein